jgi:hypothetical protein
MRELTLSQYAELEGFPGCSWPGWWLGGVTFRRDVSQVGRTSLDLVQGSTRSETWRPRLRHKTVILQPVADIQAQSKVLLDGSLRNFVAIVTHSGFKPFTDS